MASHSEQLEREAEQARTRLAGDLEELRLRITPGQMVDQVADYAREGPAAEFLANLTREMRQNPGPLLLRAAGAIWLIAASGRSSRRVILRGPEAVVTRSDLKARATVPAPVPAPARNVQVWEEAAVSPAAE